MKFSKYLLTLGIAALCCSCSVTKNRTYAPATSQFNIQMNDLRYLGETEISVDYRTYLGFIRVIDRLNGESWDGTEIRRTDLKNGGSLTGGLYGRLDRAAFKVLEKYPEADYFVVVNQSKHKTRLFLGAEVTETAKVRAYAFK